jgi:lysyl-tRNA synthetase class 2
MSVLNDVGEEAFAIVKKGDIGDIVGVTGSFFKHVWAIYPSTAGGLHCCQIPASLPEKFHGLTNTEAKIPSAVCGPDHESGNAARL